MFFRKSWGGETYKKKKSPHSAAAGGYRQQEQQQEEEEEEEEKGLRGGGDRPWESNKSYMHILLHTVFHKGSFVRPHQS